MKKYKKDALDMVTTGATLGLGSAVLGKVPHTGNAQIAIGNMSGFMPIAGTLQGASTVMNMTSKLGKKKKKKKK